MKRLFTRVFIFFLSLFFLKSCVTSGNGEISSEIKKGTYKQVAQKVVVGDSVLSVSPIGNGYLSKTIRFFEGDSLVIKVQSDIVNENGQARGNYIIDSSNLSISILSSTTHHYSTGEKVTFSSFRQVDSSFTMTFKSTKTREEPFTFQGPGLLLQRQYADNNDLDNDNNSAETVTQTDIYQHLVK